MKRILNDRVYDTAVDTKLGSVDNGQAMQSHAYYEENLYVSCTGRYYLHKQGGHDSPCWVAWGSLADGFGEASYGEIIEPLEASQAAAWAKRNLGEERCAALFAN